MGDEYMNKLQFLSSKYDYRQVEAGKYQNWLKNNCFTAGDLTKSPYAIMIPPPNITGILHIGHVLDTTLQDIIIRRKRMMGFDALYLPGMDHASIATQAKVEEKLRKSGITRWDLGRDEFLRVCWGWKEEYAKIIRRQWEKVGLSLDYTRERFTLDAGLNQAVTEVFIRMYHDGLIYRGERIINWDIKAKTALSNVEVEYKDIEGALYYITYPLTSGDGGITVATTRPETMFGDTAVMVHPDDPRYRDYIGKTVYIPTTKVAIPVICDACVDVELGTGAVKVTPAHDPVDFAVGQRHHLPQVLCMEEDGTMNDKAGIYKGLDRFKCRDILLADLKKSGLYLKQEKIVHAVGHSERTGIIVEPRLSKQWFVKMKPLADLLLKYQKGASPIRFHPERFENTLLQWMYNIQDWCISRQLWWGHRIPAWYKKDKEGREEVHVGKCPPEEEGWVQDEDVLDTWFSSALWPFSTLGWPDATSDLKRYFPNDVLVTGYDIIFFWVARMIFQAEYLTGKIPFKNVLIHGLIRDEQGRKISKSLGNGPDIMKIFDKFGTDSIRYFLATSGSLGQDIRYSEEKIASCWNYINKIWNISRYIGRSVGSDLDACEIKTDELNLIDKWILARLNQIIREADYNFEKFEFGEAAKSIYNFVWDDFASRYLEFTKVDLTKNQKHANICAVLIYVLTSVLKLLHPLIPFVTEDIYQAYNEGSIALASWPKADPLYDFNDVGKMDIVFSVINNIRTLRNEKNLANKKKIDVSFSFKKEEDLAFLSENEAYLIRFCGFNNISYSLKQANRKNAFIYALDDIVMAVPQAEVEDKNEAKEKLSAEKARVEFEIARSKKMLDNPSFIEKAKKEKIALERNKLETNQKRYEEIIALLEEMQV